MRNLVLLLTVFLLIEPALAQDDAGPIERRMELAQQMHQFRPAREQVDSAIEAHVMRLPENQRELFRTALKSALNYQALEQISIEAMAETYTEAELAAMVEYYAKPEARSASDKYDQYAGKVFPEIARMLDTALMRLKTGSPAP